MIDQSDLQNRILSRLSPEDFVLLGDKLEAVSFGRGAMLAAAGEPLHHA